MAHLKPSRCLCRRKASAVWAGNLLPHENSYFHFCPFCLEEKITNAAAYTQKTFLQRDTEKEHSLRLQRGLESLTAWPGEGTGPGRWDVSLKNLLFGCSLSICCSLPWGFSL